jgi:hypothetical protein
MSNKNLAGREWSPEEARALADVNDRLKAVFDTATQGSGPADGGNTVVVNDTSGEIIASANSKQFSRRWTGEPKRKQPIVIEHEPAIAIEDPRLAEAASKIRALHDSFVDHLTVTLDRAMSLGDALIEAKPMVGHGRWLAWLSANTKISESESQRYMQVARNREVIEAKAASMRDLTLSAALKLVGKPREETTTSVSTSRSSTKTAATEVDSKDEQIARLKDENAALTTFRDNALAKEKAGAQAEPDTEPTEVATDTATGDMQDSPDGDGDIEPEKPKSRKSNSRPARWADAVARATDALQELIDIQDEYRDWAENLPENLQSGMLADKLQAVTDIDFNSIIEMVGEAEAADLPLGFGRD